MIYNHNHNHNHDQYEINNGLQITGSKLWNNLTLYLKTKFTISMYH